MSDEGPPGEEAAPHGLARAAERLRRYGLYYIERYGSTTARLRTMLARKADRLAAEAEFEAVALRPTIEAIEAFAVRNGLIDDARFAEARAARMRQAGRSARRIAAGLRAKGVAAETAAAAIAAAEGDDLAAAIRYARRRRFGPWDPSGAPDRQRQLAAMARAGFGARVARRVVTAASEEELQEPD